MRSRGGLIVISSTPKNPPEARICGSLLSPRPSTPINSWPPGRALPAAGSSAGRHTRPRFIVSPASISLASFTPSGRSTQWNRAAPIISCYYFCFVISTAVMASPMWLQA
jgi:hypothetical protein